MSIAALLSALCCSPAFADPGLAPLLEAQARLRPQVHSLPRASASRRVAAAASDAATRLDRWLGLVAEARGGAEIEAGALIDELSNGLSRGRWRSLILGETHSVREEKAFAARLMSALLDRRLVPAVFLRERHTYDDTSLLAAHGVPVLDYRNQFQPAPEVDAALKRYRGLLVTYAGHAHASERVKDYVQNVLEAGRPFGYGPGLKDMPTIEDALAERGKRPAIVAMVSEEGMLSRIQYLFLKQASAPAPDGPTLRAGLREVLDAWAARMAALPDPGRGLRFLRHPSQGELFLGLTRGDRRARALEAAFEVLGLPDVQSWLGSEPVSNLESLRRSSGGAHGGVVVSYEVIVHRQDGSRLSREVMD